MSSTDLNQPLIDALDAVDNHPSPTSQPPHHTKELRSAMKEAAKDYAQVKDHAGDDKRRRETRGSTPDSRKSYPDPNNISSSNTLDVPQLYDEDEVLKLTPSVAHGYIVLLSCCDVDEQMSLAALTDGNVVDACFGAGPGSELRGADRAGAMRSAKEVKDYVRGLPEELKPLAVECYVRLFKIVEVYHESLEEAGWLLGCCKEGEIRKVAIFEMRRVFRSIATGSGVPPPPLE